MNSETAAALIGAGVGGGISLASSLILFWIQQKGKWTTEIHKIDCVPQNLPDGGGNIVVGNFETASSLRYHCELRITNHYPVDQAISVSRVQFFDKKPGETTAAPLDDASFTLRDRYQAGILGELQVPARGFKTATVDGEAGINGTDQVARAAIFKNIKGIQISLLVFPKRTITIWHEFTDQEFPGRKKTP
jgi:hypothetical protein